ncbi:MAG: MaoC family dehydratase N-terminal domain-containing protein [Dehalococcoidia bacterium]|nr:MaoC family dehydratase N-terminal domain-containing protein [Dehalococcoidia bacterium]
MTIREQTAARLAAGVGAPFTPQAPVTPALAGNLGIGYSFRILPRNILHSAQTIRVAGNVAVGDEVRVRGRLAGIARRGARAFVTVTARVETRRGLAWWIASECCVPGMQTVQLDEAADGLPPVPSGTETAADSWTPSLDEMIDFSGPGNFHSDPEVARAFGYAGPVVQGMHVAARAMAVFPGIAGTGRELHMWFTGLTLEGEDLAFSLRRGSGPALWVVVTGPDDDCRMLLVSRPADTGVF